MERDFTVYITIHLIIHVSYFPCFVIKGGATCNVTNSRNIQLGLLNSADGENLFVNRVFDLFDEKQNGVIEFEEFVHVLSIFHPCAPIDQKIDFAFRLYDLRLTGFIEREEGCDDSFPEFYFQNRSRWLTVEVRILQTRL